jgi:hypothetical protein
LACRILAGRWRPAIGVAGQTGRDEEKVNRRRPEIVRRNSVEAGWRPLSPQLRGLVKMLKKCGQNAGRGLDPVFLNFLIAPI